ncbi:hypothetical protein [Brevundimonas sp.]|uniref:hypothetical protein n=1 Tax=Brevundimonas sp. TaxID=1871086 RepID=UPI001A18E596|nr:hypothetical protein [Brevundimonas sp.]MBJ7486582.1 hypothetical protein [Brevundimonas sp.]
MSIPPTSESLDIARRVIWFEQPEQALSDATRFLAYAFRYATHEDMRTLRRTIDDDVLRTALDQAPPGIIDARSWSYWRLMLDLPTRPLPSRSLD